MSIPRFSATPSELLDIHLMTVVAVRPGQLAAPLSRIQRAVFRQRLRTPLAERSAMAWQWRCEFGRLAEHERSN